MKIKKPAALLTAFAAALNVGCSVYGPPPDEPVSDVMTIETAESYESGESAESEESEEQSNE